MAASSTYQKGLWGPGEDEALRRAVQKHGPRRWSEVISKEVPGRSARSCWRRWRTHLASQEGQPQPFTEEEDIVILRAHSRFGGRWAYISTLLENRTGDEVRKYWHSSLKRKWGLSSGARSDFAKVAEVSNKEDPNVPLDPTLLDGPSNIIDSAMTVNKKEVGSV